MNSVLLILPRQGSSAGFRILTRRASEGKAPGPSLARFEVAPVRFRPEGAATNQPRAPPWDDEDFPRPPARNGRSTRAPSRRRPRCGALSDVTMKVKGVGSDDARTRAATSAQAAAPQVGVQERVPLRVPLLSSVVMPNRWARSWAAWEIVTPRLWAHRSRTFPLAPQEASKP